MIFDAAGIWSAVGRVAHRMVDDAISYPDGVHRRTGWQPLPDAMRAACQSPVPPCA